MKSRSNLNMSQNEETKENEEQKVELRKHKELAAEAKKDLQEKQKAWDEHQRKMQGNIDELQDQNDNME